MPPQLPELLMPLNPYALSDMLRLGVKLDGGYVIPQRALNDAEALIVLGVGNDWSFERDITRIKPNIVIHAYDHSITFAVLLKRLLGSIYGFCLGRSNFYRIAVLLRACTDIGFLNHRMVHFRERVCKQATLADEADINSIMSRLGMTKNILFKMDIEGDEYALIDDILRYQQAIHCLIIEFHKAGHKRELFLQSVNRILEHFHIVHIHGNNHSGCAEDGWPNTPEITFLNKRFPISPQFRDRLPVAGLDWPNNPQRPDIAIWFK
jgi:hypothetical protein